MEVVKDKFKKTRSIFLFKSHFVLSVIEQSVVHKSKIIVNLFPGVIIRAGVPSI